MRILLVIHNVRSVHNVGSLLRTAECLGVSDVYISGISPYPKIDNDTRLPHVIKRIQSQLHKTALGAEDMLSIRRFDTFDAVIEQLRKKKYSIVAVEQATDSTAIFKFRPVTDTALVLGNELNGLEKSEIALCDQTVEIPMHGKKESLNVVQAAAIALYQATTYNTW